MEKRFVIKVTCVGKPTNPNFAGAVHTYIYGKAQCILAESTSSEIHSTPLTGYNVFKYGYTTKHHAMRSYIVRNKIEQRYWDETVEIVEYNVYNEFNGLRIEEVK